MKQTMLERVQSTRAWRALEWALGRSGQPRNVGGAWRFVRRFVNATVNESERRREADETGYTHEELGALVKGLLDTDAQGRDWSAKAPRFPSEETGWVGKARVAQLGQGLKLAREWFDGRMQRARREGGWYTRSAGVYALEIEAMLQILNEPLTRYMGRMVLAGGRGYTYVKLHNRLVIREEDYCRFLYETVAQGFFGFAQAELDNPKAWSAIPEPADIVVESPLAMAA